jgi:Synergist-CTERM protein sorting domain-containing protein
VRIVEITETPIIGLFKAGKFPKGAVVTEKGFKYTELFEGTNTILSNSMLNGWTIVGVTPHSGNGWQSGYEVGRLYIKFTGEVYDEVVKVTLEKDGETKEIEIEFSGEKEFLWKKIVNKAGCNAGAAVLALLVICPLFIRRKN